MPRPRDADDIDQTVVPNTPPKSPPRPSKPAKGDTAPHPAASDATVQSPPPPSAPETDPDATLDSGTRPPPAPSAAETEATLLPSSSTTGAPADPGATMPAPSNPGATLPAPSDPGATLPTPAGRTVVSGSGSVGPLGSDTAPVSISGPGGKLGPSPSATGTMVGRFALQDLHASGGLGEVFKARDTELNREVAVKRIKSQYADDGGSRHRFLTEAQLTAKLDHPGVVPVFGLVNDVRGRPCYAMRFIRGETLKDEIERYHGLQKTEDKGQKTEAEQPTGTTPENAGLAATQRGATAVPRTVAFRQLLGRFIATCQAIAYAHSRNIIHRDIKPANIMVGTFGETLVVDWGLAKSLDDGPDFDRLMRAAASNNFRHDPEATDLPTHATMAGTAVGTPAYMPPEQAAGEIDKVGPRADIYALGATLYVILTGKAPVSGRTTVEVLDRVRRGEYESAVQVNPEAPKPLDAIARKAMALRSEDRYASALELAADVERWLSDEPVSCYQDPFFARLARWARRHPARVATAVSLLLAGVLAVGGIAWAIHEGEKATRKERDRVVEEQKKTDAALKQVTEEQGRTKTALNQVTAEQTKTEEQRARAVALGKVATSRYEKAVAAYNVLVKDIDKKMADRAGLQDLRKTLLMNATEGLKQLIADGGGEGHIAADRTLVAAYRQMGEVYQIMGETAKARENFQKAVELAKEVQRESLPADQRDAARDLGRSLERLAGIHQQAGDTKAALTAVDDAIKLFEELAKDKADAQAQQDLAAAKAFRAKILAERGETGKAMTDAQDALTLRRQLADAAPNDLERQRDLASSLDALAGLQLRTGHTKDAIANAEKTLQVRKELAKQFPEQPDVQRELAHAYTRLGEVHFERAQMTKAREAYREGVEVLKALANKDEKSVNAKADLAAMYSRLGHVQLRTGNIEDAVANTKTGADLAAELQTLDPDSASAKRGLALARELHGDALLAIGRINDGIAEYAASEKLLRPLRAQDAENARAKLDLARTLERLGDGSMAKQDMASAIVAYGDSVKIREEVADKDAGSASAKRDLAMGLYKLANAYCGTGKPGVAEKYAIRAMNMFIELAAADPDSAQTQRDIAMGYAKWGQVLAAGGHITGALIVWQSSLDRCEKLAKVDAGNVQAKEDEAAAWERLANFYATLGYSDRALAAAHAAVDLWTAISESLDAKTKAGRYRIALAMLRCGDINAEVRQLNAARDWYKKAAKEVAGDPADPLLGPVAKRAADQQVFVDAVEAGLRNPAEVQNFPESVRAPALRTVATLELRGDRPVTAAAVNTRFAAIATTAADKYAVARIFAGCAASSRVTKEARDSYAADAVKHLKLAIAAGFHDLDALGAPEWDEVRQRAPEFAKVRAELEKKLKEAK